MTAQISSSSARISASLRHACSFASMIALTGSPVAAQCASNSAPLRNG